MIRQLRICFVTFTFLSLSLPVLADSAVIPASFDRWNYPFNASPGSRLTGTTFGAVGIEDFDDHDAQILVGFDTADAGVPAQNIEITSLTVQLTTSTDQAFQLDPSYDAISTYIDPATDSDPGRPVELYGIGFRNGFFFPAFGPTIPGPIAFEEGEAYVFGNPVAESVRNAFMTDGVRTAEGGLRDSSNNVEEGYDLAPWAVGSVSGLAAGDLVPVDSALTFEVDLSNPQVAAYVQSGIENGGLFFSVVSMHDSTLGSDIGIPSFYLGDPNLPDLDLPVAQLSLNYEVVPEPWAGYGLLTGVVMLAATRKRRS